MTKRDACEIVGVMHIEAIAVIMPVMIVWAARKIWAAFKCAHAISELLDFVSFIVMTLLSWICHKGKRPEKKMAAWHESGGRQTAGGTFI
jgi:hypothetical protein